MASDWTMGYPPRVADLAMLDALREKGVTRATFHADGSLASVEFAPETADAVDPQHETPAPAKRKTRSVGGLVPSGPAGST